LLQQRTIGTLTRLRSIEYGEEKSNAYYDRGLWILLDLREWVLLALGLQHLFHSGTGTACTVKGIDVFILHVLD